MAKSCKDCPDRFVGCHSTCPDYLEQTRKNEEIRKARQKKNDEETFYRIARSHNRAKGRWS